MFASLVVLAIVVLINPPIALADYDEECLSEGCNSEEVRELYSSYQEECINEGCSNEEVIELAGHPNQVSAMLDEFRRRGFMVPADSPGPGCTATGTRTRCIAVTLWCQDWYQCPSGTDACPPDDRFCPGGNTSSAYYICGGCIGFDF